MTALRHLVRRRDRVVLLLLAAVLALRLLVPAGFMPVTAADGTITVQICGGVEIPAGAMPMAHGGMPMKHGDGQMPKAGTPCAFAGLAMPMLAGADPLLLAVALAFTLTAASRFVPLSLPRSPAFLRPPMRGPPATA